MRKAVIIGASSGNALRGSGQCPSYNASKAFVSNYLDGIRCKVNKMNANMNLCSGLIVEHLF